MPTCDFRDEVTGEVFEEYFRSHPIPENIINAATGNNSSRVYSGNVGFEFKGTGFYATDYKNK
jgi:predicted nucleic acid-binding Zn ribbon protein